MTTNTNSAQERTASIDLAQLDKTERLAEMFRGITAFHPGHFHHLMSFANSALEVCALARRSLTSDHRETTSGAPADQALIDMEVRKDAAYYERNQVVAALAKCFPSGVAKTTIEGWSEDWHGCVYIDLPTGQVSWHFHDSQAHLFANLPPYAGKWDGHDTPEKYRRVGALEVSAGAAAKTEQAPVGYIAEDARGMLAAGRPITLNVSADNVGPWCVPIYLAASSATAAGAGSAQPRDTCAEMRALCSSCGGTGDVHSIDGEWRGECNCPAGISLTLDRLKIATAKTQRENEELRAALARAPSRDAGQEEASTQPVQSIEDYAQFHILHGAWLGLRDYYQADEPPEVAEAWRKFIAYIDGRTAGTAGGDK